MKCMDVAIRFTQNKNNQMMIKNISITRTYPYYIIIIQNEIQKQNKIHIILGSSHC